MDITSTILKLRSDPLLLGDYNSYRAFCSRRISKLRRNLYGKSTGRSRKYVAKATVTPENIAQNPKYAHLLLYTAERAWAFAMYMKSDSTTAPSGPTRSHIITRFNKAHRYAKQLLNLLQDPASGASQNTILEARAYADSLAGAIAFEKKQWEQALTYLCTARIIYLALEGVLRGDVVKDTLAGNIDPSVRYSAYQLRLPRTQDIDTTSREFFPKDEEALVAAVKELDSEVLNEPNTQDAEMGSGGAVVGGTSAKPAAVRSITWRTRTAPVEDADVAIALGSVVAAEKNLESYLDEHKGDSGKARADKFDDILAAWQDSADVVKKTIDDALNDGANAGDERIQALQIINTYVNYNLISWRIRRNSTMASGVWDDKKAKDGAGSVAGLKEEVALWDAILQDLEQATELPGVAADEEFGKELELKRHYYLALKCSAIATSHTNINNRLNALALYNLAYESLTKSLTLSTQLPPSPTTDPFSIPPTTLQTLATTLKSTIQHHHALAEMDKLTTASRPAPTNPAKNPAEANSRKAVIDQLDVYPSAGVDFGKLIDFPPRVKAIPVKPVFFDIAWNYIEYPGLEGEREVVTSQPAVGGGEKMEVDSGAGGSGSVAGSGTTDAPKRGWFGWGR